MHAISALVALLAVAAAATGAEPTHVYRFDESPVEAQARRAEVEIVSDPAPFGGGGCLAVTPRPGKEARVVLDVPEGVNMSHQSALTFHLRLREGVEGARLRWSAVDGESRVIFQRRVLPETSGEWDRIHLPLLLWRWGNDFVGDWSEVRKLVLQVEFDTGTFCLDELRIEPAPRRSGVPGPEWYLADLAFGRGSRQVLVTDGVMVATDAAELSEDDLRDIADRLIRIRMWVRRVFGDACRPIRPGRPTALLIFSREADYRGFFESLGERWLATIRPPDSDGYTVQDISGSTYSEEHGADRPVWFHEGVHCMVTRELRLLTSVPEHSWLHEGLANYLQLCVYPESMDRRHYVRSFRAGVGEETLFRPLSDVMTERASSGRYAQVAGLVAFLLEDHPDWVRALATGLAEGTPVEDILEQCGTDFDELQREWLAWGREHFSPDAEPPAGPGTHFALPREFAPAEAAIHER